MRVFAVSAAVLLAAGSPQAHAERKAPKHAAEPIFDVPAISGSTEGTVVLRAPGVEEILFHSSTFEMGSEPNEVPDAIALCKKQVSIEDWCDLLYTFEYGPGTLAQARLEELLANELVVHPVTLSAFWLDRTEVTVADYRRCVEAGPCAAPPYDAGGARFHRDNLPVSLVTWEDAQTYCTWRGKRLPTEAEWERAARGLHGRRFPWGAGFHSKLSNHGTFGIEPAEGRARQEDASRELVSQVDGHDGFAELAPVGSFPEGRTPEGIDDLAGNAAEWVQDGYEDRYEPVSAYNPKGATASPVRVLRGGGFIHGALWMRGAARLWARPNLRAPWVGFRCARDAG